MQISDRVLSIKPSPTIAMSAKARALKAAGKDIINLSIGEPDFPTPDYICEAAIAAVRDDKNHHYPPVDGVPELKKAIQAKLKRDNQLDYELSEILVSAGAKHSIYNALQALLNPGDEFIIPAPYWVSYPDMAMLAGAKPVIVAGSASQKYKITSEQLAQAITPKTRLLLINSPSNPTGVAYSREELQALGEVLKQYPDVAIITDDIYEHIYWGDTPFCNIVMACPELRDRTIVINGVSKAYAMTGWRIGFMAGPESFVSQAKKVQSQSTSGVAAISQIAAAAALNGSLDSVKAMVAAFKKRHDYFVEALNAIKGFEVLPVEGAFYCFIDVSGFMRDRHLKDDIAVCELLLNEAEIASVPGSAFGLEGHVRVSYATSMETLKQAIARLQSL